MTAPTPPSDIVAIQNAIYQSSNPTRRQLHRGRHDWVASAIVECGETAGSRQGDALEIGPGSGIYVPQLLATHRTVTICDVEALHLDQVRGKFGAEPALRILQDNILDSALPACSFDTILCSEVIEHIPDTDGVLAAIARLLRPGGKLILTTPQKYSFLELCCKVAFLPGVIQIVRAIYREPVLETGHINLMTRIQLDAAMSRAGLATVRRDVMGLYVPLIAEFGGLLASKWALRMGERLKGGPFEGVLWTQCVLARKT